MNVPEKVGNEDLNYTNKLYNTIHPPF